MAFDLEKDIWIPFYKEAGLWKPEDENKTTLASKLKFLIHNTVCHPIAGICWFIGLNKLGDYVHDQMLS